MPLFHVFECGLSVCVWWWKGGGRLGSGRAATLPPSGQQGRVPLLGPALTRPLFLPLPQGWRMPPTTGMGRRGRIYYGTQVGWGWGLEKTAGCRRPLLVLQGQAAHVRPRPASTLHPPLPACEQAGVKPPTFVLFCNDTKLFPEDYRKFIERQLR